MGRWESFVRNLSMDNNRDDDIQSSRLFKWRSSKTYSPIARLPFFVVGRMTRLNETRSSENGKQGYSHNQVSPW